MTNIQVSNSNKSKAWALMVSPLIWFAFVLFGSFGAVGFLNGYPVIAWICGILIHYYALKESRTMIPVMVLLLFNSLFFVYATPHVFWDIDLIYMPISVSRPYITQTLWQIGLMVSVIMFCGKLLKHKTYPFISFADITSNMQKPRSAFCFYLIMTAICIAAIFFIKGENILGKIDSYSLYVENLSGGSGLPEYLLIAFFWAALLINTKMQKIVWYCVIMLYVVLLLSFGLRVVALMGAIMTLWFSALRLSPRKTILVFVMGYFLFALFGLLKISTQSDYLLSSIFYETNEENIVSHHGNVLWASSQMLSLIDQNIIDFKSRADFLTYLSMNSVIPSSIVQKIQGGYLGSVLQQGGYTSGGGHAATYAFVALSFPGIVLFGGIIGLGSIFALSGRRGLFADSVRCWFMFTLITFPRWISYDLGNFFLRLPLYAAFGYAILIILTRSQHTSKAESNA